MVYMPHWPLPLGLKEVDLGLARVKDLLEVLGNPHHEIKNIIHIAGTNGKGSTQAFLMSILKEAGYRVNAYTSPHLVEFNERINLNGNHISDDYLYQLAEECRIAAENAGISPTFFEGSTVIALLAFAKSNADFLILETGMGGRFDATNIFDKPLATIITTIDLDHTEFLGDTVQKIALEKAGIIKPGVPCIISAQREEVNKVLLTIADSINAPTHVYEYDWGLEPGDQGANYLSDLGDIENLQPSLLGDHQYVNMGNAIAAIRNFSNYKISDDVIRRAVGKTKWRGRIEKLLPGTLQDNSNFPIWVDGAHNKLGSHVLALWLEGLKIENIYLLVGITKGRNVQNFLSSFDPNTITLVAGVSVNYEPNSYSGKVIAEKASDAGFNAAGFEYVEDAINYIKNNLKPGSIIVTGSLFLAGEVLSKNKSQYKEKLQ